MKPFGPLCTLLTSNDADNSIHTHRDFDRDHSRTWQSEQRSGRSSTVKQDDSLLRSLVLNEQANRSILEWSPMLATMNSLRKEQIHGDEKEIV